MEKKTKILIGLLVFVSLSTLSSAYAINGNSEFLAKLLANSPFLCDFGLLCDGENLDNINFIYAEMHFHNDTVGSVVALTEDTWANITAFDQGESGNTLNGFSYSNSVLTVNVEGLYKVDYSVTFTGTVNNKYHIGAAINGDVQFNIETHDRISTGTDILSASGTGFLSLNTSDEITLMILNEDSGGDATIVSANINLIRIGNS